MIAHNPVHARRGFLLQREVGHAQRFQVVDVVQKRREPQLFILLCCSTYPLQRTGRVVPARCPGRVLLGQAPFGQPFSLHPLRGWLSSVVRRLPRYCRAVRRNIKDAHWELILSVLASSILQTPHRFRTKRQLWTYSGLGIETHSSADHRSVDGQLQRSKKQLLVRGLNRNCNHDLKNLFKGAAIVASSKPGPFAEFYAALVVKGTRPEMARLTLARKIATIALIVWKKGVCFDAQYLKPQTA
jgi:hypothetical protein